MRIKLGSRGLTQLNFDDILVQLGSAFIHVACSVVTTKFSLP